MFDKTTQLIRSMMVILVLGILSACATSVTVTGQVPEPLVAKLPLTGQIQYSNEFTRYSYAEKEKGRALSNIDFGQAQVDLFDRIFSKLINLIQGESEQTADLRIVPELLDFQYTAPRETKQNLYEIWLKYRLKIIGNDDQEIADWVVKGYGKTPTATLTSPAKAFNSATNIALRDVGAQLAIGFPTQPAIEDLLKRSGKPSESIPETAAAIVETATASDSEAVDVTEAVEAVSDE